jgi:hypothetical protein
MYICIKLFLSLCVIQSIYATRLHRFGSFDWMYQKASTYDRRSQLIIIMGSVVLLASIISILVVRSNLSIKFYHPTTSLTRKLFVMQENSWNCTTEYTKWTCCCTGEKWFLLILTVFHNGKQEKFTFSYRKGIAFSDF